MHETLIFYLLDVQQGIFPPIFSEACILRPIPPDQSLSLCSDVSFSPCLSCWYTSGDTPRTKVLLWHSLSLLNYCIFISLTLENSGQRPCKSFRFGQTFLNRRRQSKIVICTTSKVSYLINNIC